MIKDYLTPRVEVGRQRRVIVYERCTGRYQDPGPESDATV
ncbi:MAG: hypothetical protein SBU_000387 [Candidatus Syntrophoarchaeum butanivorans]|uniref:Uncharacterized protein n=1 Tax=Candidatus Syntropharchaeum butanivorans TaxID=1839936 RepID=A0A1F2P587_9EURY|nr:MAG: hypothetical protein SBU_000387 [Candidatus Syntrophoarchaeum butanivorans]